MPNKYSVYQGNFPCHTCQQVVTSLRFYSEDKLATWLCSDNHMTQVSFEINKKTKKDYEREIRD